jgi:DNA phosphorothioation-associated putative methyltransferase
MKPGETTATVGKNVGGSVYVHRTAVGHLREKEAGYLKSAIGILGREINNWNVARVSNENVAFLQYDKFDKEPFPQLAASTSVDLVREQVRETDYAKHINRPILHRKELLVASDYPGRANFEKLTRKLEELGLFYDVHRIGFRNQWSKRLDEHGVVISGHSVKVRKPVSSEGVERHRTAMVRYQFSQPVTLLLRHGLLAKGKSFFDYGCGKGDDLSGLRHGEFDARGWDPFYAPDEPQIKSDIVNLGFVLNVIEAQEERAKALKTAWSLAREAMVIAVMTPSSDAIENAKPYGDGFLTSRGTFQKYYMQEHLREYVRQTIGEDPIAIAPGIFFVFRDKIAEQSFLLERYDRHRHRSVKIRPTRTRPVQSTKPIKADLLRPQLEQLWQEILDRGRYVSADELPAELIDALRIERVSLKRAEQYCRDELVDPETLEQAGADRREDLLVYFALEMFSGRQPYRQLPKGLQLDIKAFFGSHANAQIEARNLLFSTGDTDAIREACEAFADEDLGYIVGGEQMLLHASTLDLLPPVLRCYIGCAGVLYGDTSTADLIKIHIGTGKLTLQNFDDFSKALPVLKRRVKVDMRDQRVRVFNYGQESRQYLFMKSLFIPDSIDDFAAQAAFDRALQKLDVFDFSNYGPRADYFDKKLRDLGWTIEGFEIRER